MQQGLLHTALLLAGAGCGRLGAAAAGRRSGWVERLGRQHHRRLIDEVHRVHGRAIELVEVEALHAVEGVFPNIEFLHRGAR